MKKPFLIFLALACIAATRPNPSSLNRSYAPSAAYIETTIEGWRIRIHSQLESEHPALAAETRQLLADHLARVRRAVPAAAVEKMRRFPIWVEYQSKGFECMCYHISPRWLARNGYNPEKAGAVEVSNAATFLKWSGHQPYMVLHELCHGYMDRYLGRRMPEIEAAYRRAKASGRYRTVRHVTGRRAQSYAMTNVKEYFAESCEAYFGSNDYYPFTRSDLQEHDPEMYRLLQDIWGDKEPSEFVVSKVD